MKERPILFSAEMVRAILEGRKTQTRRVIKDGLGDKPIDTIEFNGVSWTIAGDAPSQHMGEVYMNDWSFDLRCPFGVPGDRLWVRETWHYRGGNNIEPSPGFVSYRADGEFTLPGYEWRPSIFMPRWASRILLEVTTVRVERLQEISWEDHIAEGTPIGMTFSELWDSINAKRDYPWESNPWVWAITFKRIEQ